MRMNLCMSTVMNQKFTAQRVGGCVTFWVSQAAIVAVRAARDVDIGSNLRVSAGIYWIKLFKSFRMIC